MAFLSLDKRVTFRRRLPTAPNAGNERGDFIDWFTVSANFQQIGMFQQADAGLQENAITGILTVRDGGSIGQVNTAHRVLIQGTEFAVIAPSVSDRSGYLTIRVERNLGG